MERKVQKIRYFGIFLIIALSLIVYWLSQPVSSEGLLRVVFLDVGQGDGILIDTPKGEHILIDGGERGKMKILRYFLSGQQRFALVIATHNHADHIGGLIEAVAGYSVNEIWISGAKASSRVFEDWINTVNQKKTVGTNVKYVHSGDETEIDRVNFLVLWPIDEHIDVEPNHQHEATIVVKMSYGLASFLFTGDLELEGELGLVQNHSYNLAADVLKVSHHGSKYSTTQKFLELVDPEIGVISVGAGNTYGHPHAETLERLSSRSVRVYRTDQGGTVTVKSNGDKIWVETVK